MFDSIAFKGLVKVRGTVRARRAPCAWSTGVRADIDPRTARGGLTGQLGRVVTETGKTVAVLSVSSVGFWGGMEHK